MIKVCTHLLYNGNQNEAHAALQCICKQLLDPDKPTMIQWIHLIWCAFWWDIFPIVNFPFICSNIPAAPTYVVYISQLIRYSRVCGSYQDFLDRGLLLTRKLLNQGFLLIKLKSSLRKFYGHHHDLVDRYGISVPQMTMNMFHLS